MYAFGFSKRYFSISKAEPISLQSTHIARQRVGVFVRQGKKEKIEKAIRSIVFTKTKVEAPSIVSKGSKRASIFWGFIFSATPFVTLKRRRRGKRPSVKVGHISRVRGARKALQTLSSSLRSGSSKSTSFSNSLWRQLDSISSSKRGTSTSNSDIRERRDSIHKQASASVPSTWIRKTIKL